MLTCFVQRKFIMYNIISVQFEKDRTFPGIVMTVLEFSDEARWDFENKVDHSGRQFSSILSIS